MRSRRRANAAERSSRWERRRYAASKPPAGPRDTAKPTSSSLRDSRSASSTGSSRISTCRGRRCSCWFPRSPESSRSAQRIATPSRWATGSTPTATRCCSSARVERSPRGRQPGERVAGDAQEPPLAHLARAELPVEVERRLVPVERHPFEAPAAALGGDARHGEQQCAAAAAAPVRRAHEQVLEVEALAAEESRVVVEVQREADRLPGLACDQRLGVAPLPEQLLLDLRCGRDAQVRQLLVFGELAHHGVDRRNVAARRRAYVESLAHRGVLVLFPG